MDVENGKREMTKAGKEKGYLLCPAQRSLEQGQTKAISSIKGKI